MADPFVGKTFFLKQESTISDWKKIIEMKVSKKIRDGVYLVYPIMNGAAYTRNGGDHFLAAKLKLIFDGESFVTTSPMNEEQIWSYRLDVGDADGAYRLKSSE